MSSLKTYECCVVTEDWWEGTVKAQSPEEAKRLAEDAFNAGDFQQCDEEILRIEVMEVHS